MPSVFDKDYQGRADKFSFAAQFGKDVAESQNQTAPAFDSIPVNPDWPLCASCNRPFFFDDSENKYRCNFCIITIKEDFIQYSPHNKNRKYKDLAELAAESKTREAQNLATAADNQYNSIRESKARLATQSGADNNTGGYDSNNTAGSSKPVFYQLGDVRDIVRKQRNAESVVYSDHTRTSIKENIMTEPHPLDRELIEKGFQLKSSFEVNNRTPTSRNVISPYSNTNLKDRSSRDDTFNPQRRESAQYSRYLKSLEDKNSNEDPYYNNE
jgi:hypothetical protein